jgi:outer membrane immunogenic protein
MKLTSIFTVALIAGAMPLWAGSAAQITPEPVIAAPPPPIPVQTGGDWSGFYGGIQLGRLDVDGTGAADGDDATFGLHAGYDYDFGQFTFGGEIDTDFGDVDLGGAATVDNVTRLKLRAGYDLGRTLIYATGGAARVDTSLGGETGEFLGLGVAYQITDQFVLGGELLEHRFDDIAGSGVDADATSLNVRGSFRF